MNVYLWMCIFLKECKHRVTVKPRQTRSLYQMPVPNILPPEIKSINNAETKPILNLFYVICFSLLTRNHTYTHMQEKLIVHWQRNYDYYRMTVSSTNVLFLVAVISSLIRADCESQWEMSKWPHVGISEVMAYVRVRVIVWVCMFKEKKKIITLYHDLSVLCTRIHSVWLKRNDVICLAPTFFIISWIADFKFDCNWILIQLQD